MTCFRGLADDLPLSVWLNEHIFPAERNINGELVYKGTLLACAEMILGGITTFCDMYLFEDQVARAAHEASMRALVGEVLYDFPSPNYGPPEQGLAFTRDLIQTWQVDPWRWSHMRCTPALRICSMHVGISLKIFGFP
jgi:5-methylthioadenosine/S-adenosylhomocysteine deaminase